ncbi:MAG: hypothetical protein KY429_10190 [Actinobacteria bacterium]|nr:hypothetical protein [Actinomycetota bacterium]
MKSSTAVFRKNGAGLALLIAPLLLLAYDIAEMPIEYVNDPTRQLTEFSQNLGAMSAVALLFPLSQLVLIPGVFGLVHLIYERGAGLAHAGGALAVIGLFGHSVFSGAQIVTVEMAALDPSSGEFARLVDAMKESLALNIFAGMGLLGFALGFLVLAFAILRSGTAPWWVALSMIVALLLEFVGSGSVPLLGTVGAILFTGALAYLGLRILKMPEGEWIHRVRMDV